MKKIRVFIADDEPLARQKIRNLLRKDSEFEIAGEGGNGREIIDGIRQQSPDLLFLDIQMPGFDGFRVLESLEFLPFVIFVTAYDQYAVKAFEVHALDYLLKPFDRKRFQQTLDRAKHQISPEHLLQEGLRDVLHELRLRPKYLRRLCIKSNDRIFFVNASDIDWIGAEGNYVSVHSGKESYLVRETISNMEQQIDPLKFVRIHRSTIVNLLRIRELQPWFHGEYRVILQDGTELMMSRTYRQKFHQAIQLPSG